MQYHGVTFDLAVVTLKFSLGYISETVMCRHLKLGRDIDWRLWVCYVVTLIVTWEG